MSLLVKSTLLAFSIFLLSLSSSCTYFDALAIDGYLRQINEVQYDSDVLLSDIDENLALLEGDSGQVAEAIVRLEALRQAIIDTRLAIESLETPEPASVLRQHLLDLYSTGSEIIDDLILLGNYRLEAEPLIGEYQAINARYWEMISADNADDMVLAVLRDYEKAVAGVASGAETLKPPAMAANGDKRFRDSLEALRAGLSDMITGLESGDEKLIETASEKLSLAFGVNQEVAAAEREADIAVFNDKVSAMNTEIDLIYEEQNRLIAEYHR